MRYEVDQRGFGSLAAVMVVFWGIRGEGLKEVRHVRQSVFDCRRLNRLDREEEF